MLGGRAARTGGVWPALGSWLGWHWLSLANLVVLAVLTELLVTSSNFQITQVVISRESPSAAAALTRAHELSDVVGTNIFLLHTERLAREIELIPSVRYANVRARLPNRVIVEIVERKPIAVWKAINGAFLVDLEGQVIGAAPQEVASWPPVVVHDVTGKLVEPGQRIEQRVVLTVRELERALPKLGVHPQATEYGLDGLTVISQRGWQILFGDLQQLNAKLSDLAVVIELARQERLPIALVDLRPVERPYYRLIPTPTLPVPTPTMQPHQPR